MNPGKIPSIIGLENRTEVYLSLRCLQMEAYLANCNLLGQMFVSILCTHGSAYDNKHKKLKSFTDKHNMFVKRSPHYNLAVPVLDTDLLKELKIAERGMIYVEDGYSASAELIRGRVDILRCKLKDYLVQYLSNRNGVVWIRKGLPTNGKSGVYSYTLELYCKYPRQALPNVLFVVIGKDSGYYYAHDSGYYYAHFKAAFREPFTANEAGTFYDSIDANLI